MNNIKKGFTLIELLAVILILGIIALIAVPTIGNIITESKKSAFKATTTNLLSTLENKCQTQKLKGEDITKQYIFSENGTYPTIDMKGSLPTSGSAMLNDECEVSISVSNDSFTINKTSSQDEMTISEGNTSSLQVSKFYHDNAKKIAIYYMETPTVPEISQLIESYGEELANLVVQSNKVAMIFYLDENDKVIACYPEVMGFDLAFGAENLTKILDLLVPLYEIDYATVNLTPKSHVLTTDIGIFITAGDIIELSDLPNRPEFVPANLRGLTIDELVSLMSSEEGGESEEILSMFTLMTIE